MKIRKGDIVRVIGYRPAVSPDGAVDELGTDPLFQSIVGYCFRVQGFDKYGHLELNPKPNDSIWIEQDLVEVVQRAR